MQKSIVPTSESTAVNPATPTVLVRDESASNSNTSDFQLLQRLRGQIEKHRKEMKIKDAELAEAEQTVQGVNISNIYESKFRCPNEGCCRAVL